MFRTEKQAIEDELRNDKQGLCRSQQRVTRLTRELQEAKNAVEYYQKCIQKNQAILDLDAAESAEAMASIENWSKLAKTGKIEDIRRKVAWGTFGKSGKGPMKYVLLCDLTTEHIEAILATQTHITDDITRVLYMELGFRRCNYNRLYEDLQKLAAVK